MSQPTPATCSSSQCLENYFSKMLTDDKTIMYHFTRSKGISNPWHKIRSDSFLRKKAEGSSKTSRDKNSSRRIPRFLSSSRNATLSGVQVFAHCFLSSAKAGISFGVSAVLGPASWVCVGRGGGGRRLLAGQGGRTEECCSRAPAKVGASVQAIV